MYTIIASCKHHVFFMYTIIASSKHHVFFVYTNIASCKMHGLDLMRIAFNTQHLTCAINLQYRSSLQPG